MSLSPTDKQKIIQSFNTDLGLELGKVNRGFGEEVSGRRKDAFDLNDASKMTRERQEQLARALERLVDKKEHSVDGKAIKPSPFSEKYFLASGEQGETVLKVRRQAGDTEGVAILAMDADGRMSDLTAKRDSFHSTILTAPLDGDVTSDEYNSAEADENKARIEAAQAKKPKTAKQSVINGFNHDLASELYNMGNVDERFINYIADEHVDAFDLKDVSSRVRPANIREYQVQVGKAIEALVQKDGGSKYFLVEHKQGDKVFTVLKARGQDKSGKDDVSLLVMDEKGQMRDLTEKKDPFEATHLKAPLDGRVKTSEFNDLNSINDGIADRKKTQANISNTEQIAKGRLSKYRHHPKLKEQYDQGMALHQDKVAKQDTANSAQSEIDRLTSERPRGWRSQRRDLRKQLRQGAEPLEQAKQKLEAYRDQHPDFNEFYTSLYERRRTLTMEPKPIPDRFWVNPKNPSFEDSLNALEKYESSLIEAGRRGNKDLDKDPNLIITSPPLKSVRQHRHSKDGKVSV